MELGGVRVAVGKCPTIDTKGKTSLHMLGFQDFVCAGRVCSVFNTVVEKLENVEKQVRDLSGARHPPSPLRNIHRHLLWGP